ncbi:MAG: hypothetical protein IJI03_12185 [Rudaea sp.]|nr:hypothetical protein [Rudaea sp. 3F27F6]MBR0346005.1 hypothetical protein [Rudaea sp.]
MTSTPANLPPTLLVPFSAVPVREPFIAARNPRLGSDCEQTLLREYAYSTKGDKPAIADRAPGSKLFYAERYGGNILQGGGARVGFDGRYQVKGIGCNPLLASHRTDFAYSNGEILLAEAIREMIWGEVLHVALPYGAVRSPIAIGTGTLCRLPPNDTSHAKIPRGLLVREFALRPAHFTRALYFRPRKGVDIPLDSVRVRDAVRRLTEYLPRPDEFSTDEWHRVTDLERLYHGLGELAKRFARQHAVARARRFMHGAHTESNICLDGRWLDYDSISCLPFYECSPHFDPPFWFDHEHHIPTLNKLWFYVRKYFPAGMHEFEAEGAVSELFVRDLNREMKQSFLETTGIPMSLFDRLSGDDRAAAIALSVAIIQLAKAGTLKPAHAESGGPRRFGTYDVGRILFELALHADSADCDARMADHIRDDEQRARLIRLYRHVWAAVCAKACEQGLPIARLRRLAALGAFKRAAHVPVLTSGKMMEKITLEVLADDNPVDIRSRAEALLAETLAETELLYGDSGGTLAMHRDTQCRVLYDPRQDDWIVERAGIAERFAWSAAFAAECAPHPLSGLRARWGESMDALAHV